MPFVDHYKALGIAPDASYTDVHRAWVRVHYSECSDEAYRFAYIAYKCLGDTEARKTYNYEYQANLIQQQRSCEDRIPDDEQKLKHLLQEREKEHQRRAQQHQMELQRKDAEIQRQEKINEDLRKSLSNLQVSNTPNPACICRFCGKQTARLQSLQVHLRGMSTDMICVDRKITYLLQAPSPLNTQDVDLLQGMCRKIAAAPGTKIRQWQAQVPQFTAFQAKYATEIALAEE